MYDNAKVKERVFFINDETVQFNTMTPVSYTHLSFQTYTNPKFKAEGGYSKVAESAFVGALFTYAGPNYVQILNHLGKTDEAAKAQAEICLLYTSALPPM